MLLTQIEFVNGLFSLIYCIIDTLIGFFIASKYRKYKQKLLLYVGLSFPGLAIPWYSSSISFLMVILLGIALPEQLYILIGNVFLPFTLFLWMVAICHFLNIKFSKIILLAYAFVGFIFEIFLIYFILNDTTVIAEQYGPVDNTYKGFVLLYLIFTVITVIITGVWFALASFKSDKKEIRLKGKFLLIGFIFWSIGAITDGFFTLNIALLLIVRILLITSSIVFYIGWILPQFIRKLFESSKEKSI